MGIYVLMIIATWKNIHKLDEKHILPLCSQKIMINYEQDSGTCWTQHSFSDLGIRLDSATSFSASTWISGDISFSSLWPHKTQQRYNVIKRMSWVECWIVNCLRLVTLKVEDCCISLKNVQYPGFSCEFSSKCFEVVQSPVWESWGHDIVPGFPERYNNETTQWKTGS